MKTTEKFTPLMRDIVEHAAAARRASAVRSKIVIVCATITERGDEELISFEVAGAGANETQVHALLAAALMAAAKQEPETVKTAQH